MLEVWTDMSGYCQGCDKYIEDELCTIYLDKGKFVVCGDCWRDLQEDD